MGFVWVINYLSRYAICFTMVYYTGTRVFVLARRLSLGALCGGVCICVDVDMDVDMDVDVDVDVDVDMLFVDLISSVNSPRSYTSMCELSCVLHENLTFTCTYLGYLDV